MMAVAILFVMPKHAILLLLREENVEIDGLLFTSVLIYPSCTKSEDVLKQQIFIPHFVNC